MKFKYNIFLMALSVFSLWFVSCDEYRDADELDDQLYLQKSGLLRMSFWMNSAPFYPSETVMRLKWKYIIQVKTENTS